MVIFECSLNDFISLTEEDLPSHSKEAGFGRLGLEFSPNYDIYRQAEEGIYCAVAMDDATVAGYMLFFVYPHQQHDTLHAANDLFFVHPDYRGSYLWRDLIDHAEEELQERGVESITISMMARYSALMKRVGYNQAETTYMKILGV